MSEGMFWVLYVLGGSVSFGAFVGWQVVQYGSTRHLWDTPLPFLLPLIWPALAPIFATYVVAVRLGTKAHRRRLERDREQRETDRLLEREGLL